LNIYETTVDGSEIRQTHQLIWRIYHYLQGFVDLKWCRISELSTVAPENGWLEDDPFLLGFGLSSGVNC